MTLLDAVNEEIRTKFNLEDLLFFCTIPVEKHISKKNGRSVFNGKLCKTPEQVRAERHMCLHLRSEANKQKITKPLACRLWAVYLFHFKHETYFNKDGSINGKLNDLSNLLELPSDCLQHAGIIVNDTLFDSFDLSRRIPGKENKLEIMILKYHGHDQGGLD